VAFRIFEKTFENYNFSRAVSGTANEKAIRAGLVREAAALAVEAYKIILYNLRTD
jgi:hypothetical protein